MYLNSYNDSDASMTAANVKYGSTYCLRILCTIIHRTRPYSQVLLLNYMYTPEGGAGKETSIYMPCTNYLHPNPAHQTLPGRPR